MKSILFNFFKFKDTCSSEIVVQLENSAKEKFGNWYSGSFVKANGTYGGKSYWKKGDRAMWYNNGHWRIGSEENVGKNIQVFRSTYSSTSCPDSKVTEWKYWDGDWKDAGTDIKLSAWGRVKKAPKLRALYTNDPLH